ncbi:hypothetical protein FOA52_015144 [Chlamydomonas sp. UWO 241]|nr:hypothetical protein FOA52_015144 [Chlamydomonas sp. UWO 241]
MDFFKGLESFDIERVIDNSLTAVDEFPERKVTVRAGHVPMGGAPTLLTSGAVTRAVAAQQAWEEVDVEGRRPEWEDLLSELRGLPSSGAGDAWQQRAKAAEYKLAQTLSLLVASPDPLPLFQSVAQLSSRIVEVESENHALSASAAAAHADSAEVSTLVEEHRALKAQHAKAVELLQAKETELESARSAAKAGDAAAAQLAGAQAEATRLAGALKALRDEHERGQSALFEAQAGHDQELGGRQREMDVLVEDLERAQQRVADLGREAAAAAARAAGQAGSGGGAAAAAAVISGDAFWEAQIERLTSQLASVTARLEEEVSGRAAERDDAAFAAAQAASAAAALSRAAESASAELARLRPAAEQHDALVARCEALAALVDVQMEAEGWGKAEIAGVLGDGGLASHQAASAVLQERNRKLSAEVSALKRSVEETGAVAAAARTDVQGARDEAARLAALVERLEGDLLTAAGAGTRRPLPSDPPPRPATPYNNSGAPESDGASGTGANGAEGATRADAGDDAAASGGDGGSGGGGGGLFDIVVSQRDRFRSRCAQLEDEKGTLTDDVAKARRQLDEVRADNLALYEKLRYLERYSQQAAAGTGRTTVVKVDGDGLPQQDAAAHDVGSGRYQCGPLSLDIGGGGGGGGGLPGAPPGSGPGNARGGANANVRTRGRRGGNAGGGGAGPLAACFPADAEAGDEEGGGGGVEAKYRTAYEARVNPFADFQRSEADSRVRNLQLHDRALLAGSKLVAGSRAGRVFVAVYALLLHVFLLLLLYYALAPPPAVLLEPSSVGVVEPSAAAAAGGAGQAAAGGGGTGRKLAGDAGALLRGAGAYVGGAIAWARGPYQQRT